jgi:hypothetical protein
MNLISGQSGNDLGTSRRQDGELYYLDNRAVSDSPTVRRGSASSCPHGSRWEYEMGQFEHFGQAYPGRALPRAEYPLDQPLSHN